MLNTRINPISKKVSATGRWKSEMLTDVLNDKHTILKSAVLNLYGKDIDKNATYLLILEPKDIHIWK